MTATMRKMRLRNTSSACWALPGGGAAGRPSWTLKTEAKSPKGNAPIPNDIWNPVSPNPNALNVLPLSGSVRWPWGLGGTRSRGSCCLVLPRPYNGITLSLLMPALHTGHVGLLGRVSSHWCRHGQQKRCPHMLMTASRAVSRQMLHSKAELSCVELLLLLRLGWDAELLSSADALMFTTNKMSKSLQRFVTNCDGWKSGGFK